MVGLGVAAVLSGVMQLLLGAPPAVVLLALLAVAFGITGFKLLGPYNLGAWVALFYVFGNVLVALYAKTIFGQPLDSNLYAPLASFFALSVTSGALLLALLLARRIGVGQPLLQPSRDPRFLFKFSWACLVLGILFWLLNRIAQDPVESDFGGVALFRDLLFMAVIARTAALLESSANRRAFDMRLGLTIAASAFVGLIDNAKTAMALPVLSYFIAVLFYRGGLPVKLIVILTGGGFLFGSVVAPVVHSLRALGQQELRVGERIDFVASSIGALLEDPGAFGHVQRLAAGAFEGGYYKYFGGNGAGQMLLGRYASVQQIDPVISEVDASSPMGGEAVWPALTRLVPSFIFPDKPRFTEAFNTLVHYRLVDPEGGKFPTLPLAGQVYAAYGLLGLMTIPFFTFLAFFLLIKKIGWHMHRNIYAIFFFCSFVVVYAAQGDFGQYAGATLRNVPLFAALFLIVGWLCRVGVRERRTSSRSGQPMQELQ